VGKYRWHESEFITEVAAGRGLPVRGGGGAPWRLQGGSPGLTWTVVLTPASGERGPEIRWNCPDLRAGAHDPTRQLVVRPSNQERAVAFLLGDAVRALGGYLAGRPKQSRARPAHDGPPGVLGPDWTVVDPRGVLDRDLAPWFGTWPIAWWGPGDERPARLESVWLNQYGLELRAQDWWCSAAALDHFIQLGVEIASRLRRSGW
jgi:hypothetical protein